MEIYIKPMQKIQMIERRQVYLKDVAEYFLVGGGEISHIVVFNIPEKQDQTYLLSVIEIIQAIHQKYPNAQVSNVGEMDILIEYHEKQKKESKLFEYLKVVFVAIILFAGAATTIMCFHSDTQTPLIFQNYYYIFFGENKDMPALLTIPYTIGIAAGILIFFNHFSKASITDDPTPIEVEMTTYEKETNASVIDHLDKIKKEGGR